MAGKWETTIA